MVCLQSWVGAVTQLIPPNYGIVDGNAFYVEPVVVGQIPGVGDRVACEAVPNTDGGMYEWRVLRAEVTVLLAKLRHSVGFTVLACSMRPDRQSDTWQHINSGMIGRCGCPAMRRMFRKS